MVAEQLRWVAQNLALVSEAIGVAVVTVAGGRVVVRYIRDLVARAEPFPRERIRLSLGRSLALALEFLLAADILRTAVEPTWDEIERLAAIAAIRTALNFFLDREITNEERRIERQDGTQWSGAPAERNDARPQPGSGGR
ncbi:MAG: DUF1622 domain-containing protein [Chloroflexota bacterium]|nr:DUF1622 domain-containing protein [Chloroflexota bacterium]MDP9470593.1 DUF1622 domain-containing protein [Chloroflexota bacterium]